MRCGNNEKNANMQDPMAYMFYQSIFVNAQTGRLIDPANNKIDISAYQGFISWREVK